MADAGAAAGRDYAVTMVPYCSEYRGRRFIDRTLADGGSQLPTGALECSEYWAQGPGHYLVSLLVHGLAPEVLTFGAPEVLGMCAALACAARLFAPEGFDRVSDHCPVRLVDGV